VKSSSSTAAAAATEQRLIQLGELITKESLNNPTPTAETCRDLLTEFQKETPHNISLASLEATGVAKVLVKARKSFKRHKRTASGTSEEEAWDNVLQATTALIDEWKALVEKDEAKSKQAKKSIKAKASHGPPASAAEYRARLVAQQKELYKDPPVLPPLLLLDNDNNSESQTSLPVMVQPTKAAVPRRNKTTGALTFEPGPDSEPLVRTYLKDFGPNLTPEQVLRGGAFGGTYYRPIVSAVTNVAYKDAKQVLQDSVDPSWIKGLPSNMLTSSTYRTHINKYGVKCGGSLGMWESSGWISALDPYGWFQWYCRFYQGRRCADDARQLSRWLKCAGPKGRFRSQLCNKILAAPGATHDDASISPVIRQTLMHWGLEITPDILAKHKKRVGR